jgi:uncharacterized surface protein with fasciclin (FAS1) repeats
MNISTAFLAFAMIAITLAGPVQARDASHARDVARERTDQSEPQWKWWKSNSNIVGKLERLGNFSILLTALETANLKDTLANSGPFTLFAPTDQAFETLLGELGITADQLLGNPDLANILLYHVASGKLRAGQLVLKSTQETLFNSQPVLTVLEGTKVLVNRSTVTRPNLMTSNGVIHVVDRVLLPPSEPVTINSMLDVLQLDGRFTVLLAALEKTGLDSALSGTNQLTLFAPTDEAFAALLAQLGITAEQLLDNPDLSSILLYHVVAGRNGAIQLLVQREATSLQGGTLAIGLRAGGVFVNDAKVVNPNVNAPNGFVHTIDSVLLPQ